MDLGRPIGHTVPTDGFDQGEHGAGTGLSGGVCLSYSSLAWIVLVDGPRSIAVAFDAAFTAGNGCEHLLAPRTIMYHEQCSSVAVTDI